MDETMIGRRVPTQADFDLFAAISGDDNPIHVDAEFSARTRFGRTVSHGMLLYSWAWALLAEALPGHEPANAALMFPNPCYAGEEIAFFLSGDIPAHGRVTVRRLADSTELLVLETGLREKSR